MFEGKTTGIHNLKLTDYLQNTQIPIAPIDRQKQFEAIARQSDKSKLTIENSTNNQEETECLQKLILKKWSARP